MDWKRRNQIAKLVDGILEYNSLNRPPIELIRDLMKQRGIKFEERDEDDDDFCGVYMIIRNTRIIFVNSNLYEPRKNFTIAHELGHHFLGHILTDGAIICDKSALDSKNKQRPEREKEADYFAGCFLMPPKLVRQKLKELLNIESQDINFQLKEYTQTVIDTSLESLCKHFSVSKEAMRIQLSELKFT